MASSVFYKFRSQKEDSRITFDGTGISVFELKKEIILANGLAKANDFDLVMLDGSTGEEIRDDSAVIPRSSSVVIKRVPAARPGKGRASYYVGGTNATTDGVLKPGSSSTSGGAWPKGPMTKRFDGKDESNTTASAGPAVLPSIATEDEAAAMAAMFQAQTANWEETQEKMSQATRIYTNTRGTGFGGRGGAKFGAHQAHNDRPLPASYVCYRCGKKGHWIQDCPTNSDREFDNKPRIKRTTGIPRSFLKSVEAPSSTSGHVMVTPEGGYVVAQPDVASWHKRVTRPKILTESDIRERAPSDATLACPLDHKLFQSAVRTPCCGTTYCEECIHTQLLEKDFSCPNCSTRIPSLDKLVKDTDARTKVAAYIEKEIETSKEEARAAMVNDPSSSGNGGQADEDELMDPQLANDLAMRKMVADSIPQIQAQIKQLSQVMQNPSLPALVRQQTEAQYQTLQIQLAQAQELDAAFTLQQQMPAVPPELAALVAMMGPAAAAEAAAVAAAESAAAAAGVTWGMPGPQQQQQQQGGFVGQQHPVGDGAYQRLPINNRRRNLKRERPSDFLEIAGPDVGDSGKIARYWE